jgi:hypothetical protein
MRYESATLSLGCHSLSTVGLKQAANEQGGLVRKASTVRSNLPALPTLDGSPFSNPLTGRVGLTDHSGAAFDRQI